MDPRISLEVPSNNELALCPAGATNCSSFYFPGGFEYIADNPPFFETVSDEDVILFKDTQGLLIGFWQYSDLESEINTDEALCQLYGFEEAAFSICLGPSITNDGYWIACTYYSPFISADEQCVPSVHMRQIALPIKRIGKIHSRQEQSCTRPT